MTKLEDLKAGNMAILILYGACLLCNIGYVT